MAGFHVTSNDIGLYVHWPFCLSKCPYCDFNSHVREAVDQSRWRHALLQELAYWGHQTEGKRLVSVFFGGGTPSLMEPSTVQALLDATCHYWRWSDQVEVTLEANPTSVEASRLAAFRDAGVNRVSMGVQALDDAALQFLGRQHTVREALAAWHQAAEIFAYCSFDVIYALPGQEVAAWEAELREVLRQGGRHLSLYQLTIEPGTAFYHRHHRGQLPTLSEASSAELYERTQGIMQEAGLPAYEISNHAVEGHACRHNLLYWQAGDWVGIGPGAHGRCHHKGGRKASVMQRSPEKWLEQVEQSGHGMAESEMVDGRAIAEEMLMMGLRLRDGLDLEWLNTRSGHPLCHWVDARALVRLEEDGLVEHTPTHLHVCDRGRLLLNAILGQLLT